MVVTARRGPGIPGAWGPTDTLAGRAESPGLRSRQVGFRVVADGDRSAGGGVAQVRAVPDSALDVVLLPGVVQRDLELVAAGRDAGERPGPDPVRAELQPGRRAVDLPVGGAPHGRV